MREAAPIWVSMLKRNLHKIKLVTFQTQHNEWVIQFPWILSIYQQKPIGKIHFPLRKNEFWTHWEFCTYHQIFDRIFIFLRILFEDSLWGFWGFFFFKSFLNSSDLENLPLVNIEWTFSWFLFLWWLTPATFSD